MTPPFVRVDLRLLRHAESLGLDDRLVRLVVALQSYDWRNGKPCKPNQASLAELCGVSVRTLQRRYERLAKTGLVKRERLGRRQYVYDLAELYRQLDALPSDTTTGVASQDGSDTTTAVASEPIRHDNTCRLGTDPTRQQVSPDVDPSTTADPTDEDTHRARELASQILGVFNKRAESTYRAPKWARMIESRVREHPDLDLDAHRAIVERNFRAPWWHGPPSPSVIFTDRAAFERAMHAPGELPRDSKDQARRERTRRRMNVGAEAESCIEGTAVEIAVAPGDVDAESC